MNVLHISAHLGGGAGKAIVGLAQCCREKNIESEIIILEKPEKNIIITNTIDSGINIIIEPDIAALREKINNADIIVINWWDHPLMCGFLRNFPDDVLCRIIVWNHINGCNYPYLGYDFLNVFDGILFTSHFSLDNPLWSEEERENIANKSTVIYGIGDFEPSRINKLTNRPDRKNVCVGYAGTLNYSKMFRSYIKYCDLLCDAFNDLEFYFAGDPGKDILSDVSQSRYKEKYHFDGYISNMEMWYSKIDIFLYLLNPENYGTTENVILEAMSYSLPVIVYNGGAEKYIVNDNITGYIVNSSDDLLEKIGRLLSDREIINTLGANARRYVCDQYSGSKNADNFITYCKLICKKDKSFHKFKTAVGIDGYGSFAVSAGEDKAIFDEYFKTGKTDSVIELIRNKQIYSGETKSSLFHFLKYNNNDIRLKSLCKLISSI